MNQNRATVKTDEQEAKADWVLVLFLRILSVGVAYGMWILLQWMERELGDLRFVTYLMLTTVVIAALLLLIGIIMPGKVVVKTWKIIGFLLLLCIL